MRSRDHRTKRDAAFRRGGFMPRKPLRKHPPIPRRNGGCGRTSIIRVNFCCPLSWFRFYSPSQTLGSVQIHVFLTRGIVHFYPPAQALGSVQINMSLTRDIVHLSLNYSDTNRKSYRNPRIFNLLSNVIRSHLLTTEALFLKCLSFPS